MGKWDGVDPDKLNRDASTAINELSKYKNLLTTMKGRLTDSSFQGKSKVVEALDKIKSSSVNGSISELEKKLNNVVSASAKIKSYQSYEKEVQRLKDDENNYHKVNSGKKDLLGKIIYNWVKNNNQNAIRDYNKLIEALDKDINNLLS